MVVALKIPRRDLSIDPSLGALQFSCCREKHSFESRWRGCDVLRATRYALFGAWQHCTRDESSTSSRKLAGLPDFLVIPDGRLEIGRGVFVATRPRIYWWRRSRRHNVFLATNAAIVAESCGVDSEADGGFGFRTVGTVVYNLSMRLLLIVLVAPTVVASEQPSTP